MNITTDWILEIKRRFKFCEGYITKERLADFAEYAFRAGVQWLYRWRKVLIDQPRDGDIVCVTGAGTKKYYVCIWLAASKTLKEIGTGFKVPCISTTKWKLIETTENFGKFNNSNVSKRDPCAKNCGSGTDNVESVNCI